MIKAVRHEMIMDIIENQEIETQEDIARALKERNVTVTQATISRDIKELRLVKTMSSKGVYKYATMDKAESSIADRFTRIFSESALTIDSAGNLLVIKTITGAANAACEALDAMKWPNIIGTIAGDNTLLVIVKSVDDVDEIIRRFKSMVRQ
ncbi:MAG: arginine repressor [Christensenellales bacterium]|jgi:transcriptional regulator of arginine metabolism